MIQLAWASHLCETKEARLCATKRGIALETCTQDYQVLQGFAGTQKEYTESLPTDLKYRRVHSPLS